MPEKIIYDIVYGVVRRAIENCDPREADEAVAIIVADIIDSVNVAASDAQYTAMTAVGGLNPWPDLQGVLR